MGEEIEDLSVSNDLAIDQPDFYHAVRKNDAHSARTLLLAAAEDSINLAMFWCNDTRTTGGKLPLHEVATVQRLHDMLCSIRFVSDVWLSLQACETGSVDVVRLLFEFVPSERWCDLCLGERCPI